MPKAVRAVALGSSSPAEERSCEGGSLNQLLPNPQTGSVDRKIGRNGNAQQSL